MVAKVAETFEPDGYGETASGTRDTETLCEFRYGLEYVVAKVAETYEPDAARLRMERNAETLCEFRYGQ